MPICFVIIREGLAEIYNHEIMINSHVVIVFSLTCYGIGPLQWLIDRK
jgi:hypothetical protein